MFVKDALEKEVGLVVEFGGAVCRNFQTRGIEIKASISHGRAQYIHQD